MEVIVLSALFLYYFVLLIALGIQYTIIRSYKAKITVLEGTLNFYTHKPKLPDPEYFI